ncbi:unnamed protein product [Diabrotica balteata]|uniref:Uncharacterized protein n=1 Tax=Diabrotica balteata TaxID=107213 RepID=A0A9N9X6C2_DIABA|nr:unnamed protein product [Diabrotica balteata]
MIIFYRFFNLVMNVAIASLPRNRCSPSLIASTMREKDSFPRKMLVATGGHSSPKQAAIYPLSIRVPPGDEMPFDLSRNTKSPGPHMSPACNPAQSQEGEDQPLDLRVDRKKMSIVMARRQVEDENRNLVSPSFSVNSEKDDEGRHSVTDNKNLPKTFNQQLPNYPIVFPPQSIHPMMLEVMYRAQKAENLPRLSLPYPTSPTNFTDGRLMQPTQSPKQLPNFPIPFSKCLDHNNTYHEKATALERDKKDYLSDKDNFSSASSTTSDISNKEEEFDSKNKIPDESIDQDIETASDNNNNNT